MNELQGAILGHDQRQAIKEGHLQAKPPRCSHNDCWKYAEYWVRITHPNPELEDYDIPRCEEHKDSVPHTKIGIKEMGNDE